MMFVNKKTTRLLCCLATLLTTLLPLNLIADILLIFPSGTDANEISAYVSVFEDVAKEKAKGVTPIATDTQVPHQPPPNAQEAIETARQAYKNLDLEAAMSKLKEAEDQCFATNSTQTCRDLFFETNVLRGTILLVQGDEKASAQAFRTAHLISPSQVLDPRKLPPKTVNHFNKTCADYKLLPKVYVKLQSKPSGAAFSVNGIQAYSSSISLGPGRHVIEAQMHGFAQRLGFIEIAPDGTAPTTFNLSLNPLPDNEAWLALRRLLKDEAARLNEPGATRLLKRFGKNRLIFVNQDPQKKDLYILKMATPGKTETVILPPVSSPEDLMQNDFKDAIFKALGKASTIKNEGPIQPPPPDTDSLEEDPEEELVRLKNSHDEDNTNRKTDAAKIFKSPWFWVSVGIVVAVTGGTIIGVNAD